MRFSCFTLATILAAMGIANAVAADEGVVRSSDCRRALASLDAQESAAVSARERADVDATRRAMSELGARRADVSRACLSGVVESPAPRATARAPVSVTSRPAPSSGARLTNAPDLPRLPVAPPVPNRPAPPTFITGCDAGGCWASDGTRLPRAGAGLLSPQGLCSVQGSVVNCGR